MFSLNYFLGMMFGYGIELQYSFQKHVYISHFSIVTKHELISIKLMYYTSLKLLLIIQIRMEAMLVKL